MFFMTTLILHAESREYTSTLFHFTYVWDFPTNGSHCTASKFLEIPAWFVLFSLAQTSFFGYLIIFQLTERIADVKHELVKFAQDHPGDKERIRVEAIKRLEDIVEKLPLKKSVIEAQEHQIKNSLMLQQIVALTDKRELRERIRRALADYIAEDIA